MQIQAALPGRVAARVRQHGSRLPRSVRMWGGAFCLALFAVLMAVLIRPGGGAPAEVSREAAEAAAAALPVPAVRLADPQDLMPIAPATALAINAARPLSTDRVDPAVPLVVGLTRPGLRDTALQCLTSALYYEAGSESDDGQRAVAQVILNRVRHPAFPSSVCGVVYQGSNRRTGCQFTFTCDGSLARVPSAGGWSRSRRLAEAALSGKVFAPVGYATQYHADYVVPYWASSFDKVRVIGRHIFYRLKGRAGARAAFRQRYGGVELLPGSAPAAIETEPEVATETAVIADSPQMMADADAMKGGLIEAKGAARMERAPPRKLLADIQAGKLIATPARLTVAPRRASAVAALGERACEAAQPAGPAKPLDAATARSQAQTDACS